MSKYSELIDRLSAAIHQFVDDNQQLLDPRIEQGKFNFTNNRHTNYELINDKLVVTTSNKLTLNYSYLDDTGVTADSSISVELHQDSQTHKITAELPMIIDTTNTGITFEKLQHQFEQILDKE